MKLLLLLTMFAPQFAFGWAAIAYSDNKDGTWAVFAEWAQVTQAVANQKAINGCKGKGGKFCNVVKGAINGCHSISVTNEGGAAWGVASADNQESAQDKSIVKCLAVDPVGSCVVRKSFCDPTCNGVVCPWVQSNAYPNEDNPTPLTPGPFYCRSPGDFNRCKAQTGQGFGTADDRLRYCKMAFC